MSWVNDTLQEFGHQMGLKELGFGEHGVAQLVFHSGSVLAVEPVQRGDNSEVLVYLSRPLGFDGPQRLRSALSKAHFRQAGMLDVQVAVRGQDPDALLLALIRFNARDFTLQALDQAFDYLNRWHDSLST